jgi:SNF family Na+-dependent transporter
MDPLNKHMQMMNESVSHQGDFCKHMDSIQIDDSEEETADHKIGRYHNKVQFWLTCLGSAVGYGNIWRFPYMLYNNGGGVFFIPFIVCIVVIWYPFYYLEVGYGQLYRKTMHTYFSFRKEKSKFQGISLGIWIILFFQTVLYLWLLSWWFNFFLFSFWSPLPWSVTKDTDHKDKFWNENYFREEFLQTSDHVFDINKHVVWIMVSMVWVAILTFITVIKGMDSAKMAVYIIIPLPYIIMFLLLMKGISLEGWYIGWNYLFTAEWERLFTFQIWRDAAGQVLFSSGIGINLTIHFASLNSK